ncbi:MULTISPECIES: flagellar basal body P-ring protein FlgI [unclassified Campylobacter]|uniref:flagellar basal body P-ring protein FlgI n=1 Tax=unclassified Campylobacter TaxID=2593542 RepID=UPI001E19C983|nr:flagellar basal body P-ring protein FlgI [Campylobacter sp. RM9331]MBZ8005350.1 flagellar basal body P-ring protein FlgI [Campylobacter sp. RM9332]
MRFMIFLIFILNSLMASQIKDIANIVGVRDNELIGYGLVVGLNGSGDGSSSEFTIQSIANMLGSMNIKINPDDIKSKNTAAVMISAKLPAFAKSGDKIDVNVASLGDAKSLKGGTLLLSALKGVDGNIYALAQGALSIDSSGKGASMTNAKITNGASIEREVNFDFNNQERITLSLKQNDFALASKIKNAINKAYDLDIAKATDGKTIIIERPEEESAVDFIAKVLSLDAGEINANSKIIINEKTGTIISGIDVEVSPVLISHGNITIKIEPKRPYELKDNEVDLKDGSVIDTSSNILRITNDKITLANITRALNKLGASPADVITIIKNLKQAGAINAELEIL